VVGGLQGSLGATFLGSLGDWLWELVSQRIHASPPTLWTVVNTSRGLAGAKCTVRVIKLSLFKNAPSPMRMVRIYFHTSIFISQCDRDCTLTLLVTLVTESELEFSKKRTRYITSPRCRQELGSGKNFSEQDLDQVALSMIDVKGMDEDTVTWACCWKAHLRSRSFHYHNHLFPLLVVVL